MTKHEGEHPYGSKIDVGPFVPLGISLQLNALRLVNKVAERINRELGIPIFLHEDAATRPERKNLAKVKDNLKECQKNCWKKTGSQTTVNARFTQLQGLELSVSVCHSLLSISTFTQNDPEIANKISKIIRGSSGGYKYRKAIGVMLEDRNIAPPLHQHGQLGTIPIVSCCGNRCLSKQ